MEYNPQSIQKMKLFFIVNKKANPQLAIVIFFRHIEPMLYFQGSDIRLDQNLVLLATLMILIVI